MTRPNPPTDDAHNRFSRRDVLKSAAAGALLAGAWPIGIAAGDDEVRARTEPSAFEPVTIPNWVYNVTRMTFASPSELDLVAKSGAQVLHTNLVWPYFPLRRDGGGLSRANAEALTKLVEACHGRGVKLVLGLPPFPAVELVRQHPDWRVHDEPTGKIITVEPDEKNLGTRLGCNLGPWGDYLIEVCAELVEHHRVDGFSFDGNYHPPICFCPACRTAYRAERGTELPPRADLNDVAYRKYLVWRGEKLEQHYRQLQQRLKAINPDAVVMTWTVNAGRYGHFLHSPRAMPTRMNLLIDLPMQEWWLDETNLGASVAPAFGAAYLNAVTGGRPAASEPYLMSRGNPYGTHSFPHHERLTRTLLALSHGNAAAHSLGWPGHRETTRDIFHEVARREPWITRAEPFRWAAMLVSEQTRQFYAYRNIAELFLPHVFGAFRAASEEHLPLRLVNDWDLTDAELSRYRVLVLPNAAALSDDQVAAVRRFVQAGGGLVATGETSLCDEIGQPRRDFAMADLFGTSFLGRPKALQPPRDIDANFAIHLDDNYWKQRTGVATLTWTDHTLTRDERLAKLVPTKSVLFRGPQAIVSEPDDAASVAWRVQPEGTTESHSGAIARTVGKGRVVYLAAALDAALWSYSFPYQRLLFAEAITWAAADPPPIEVHAPMCVQATCFTQSDAKGRRVIVHLFNGLNTTAHHGHPATDVPLREETIPVPRIVVSFRQPPKRCHLEPGGMDLPMRIAGVNGGTTHVEVPPLELHAMLVAEY